jgi:putative transposase
MLHAIWHCEYHIVWVPKYRYRVLQGKVKEEVELCVRDQTAQMGCEIVEINGKRHAEILYLRRS